MEQVEADGDSSVLTVGAIASAAAAIIHGTAAGVHAEHQGLSRLFLVLAVAQGGAAVVGFVRRDRVACAALFIVNAAAAIGWLITRLVGISAVAGLEVAERPGPADTVAAVLAVVAAAAAVGCARGTSTVPRRTITSSALIVCVLLVPGLADATSHDHTDTATDAVHDHADPAVADAEPVAAAEEGLADAGSPGATAVETGSTDVDDVDEDAQAAIDEADDHSGHAESATVPYDPELPIDLGGTPGVTPRQQAFAENLVASTVRDLPKWADLDAVAEAGFHSIGDGATGHEHYMQWDWIDDDVWLDPDYPESLVFEPQPDGSKSLVSAMFMLPSNIPLDEVPDWGGDLMQWHVHGDLCFTDDPVAPQVAGVKPLGTSCPPPLDDGTLAPMIHVWIVPHQCGPFAALDGIGGGQVPDGEPVLCDQAHGAH